MNDRDVMLVDEINRQCTNIANFIVDITTFEEFITDIKTCHACAFSLLQIGEDSGKMSPHFKKKYHQVPWQKMSDLRNIIVHQYRGINWNTIWQTCSENIQELSDYTQNILIELGEQI
jgi:uncharacterized protein with HEPN domain